MFLLLFAWMSHPVAADQRLLTFDDLPTVAAPLPIPSGDAFNQLWNAFDKDYALFLLRPAVDWNASYDHYRPLATNCATAWELANVFADMLRPLQDLHVSLSLILDVRANGGGNENLAWQVASLFDHASYTYAYHQYRNGPRPADLTEKMPRMIAPARLWRYDPARNRLSADATQQLGAVREQCPFLAGRCKRKLPSPIFPVCCTAGFPACWTFACSQLADLADIQQTRMSAVQQTGKSALRRTRSRPAGAAPSKTRDTAKHAR